MPPTCMCSMPTAAWPCRMARRRPREGDGQDDTPRRPAMSRDLLVGVDAGTSVIKAVAFTTAGEQVAIASRPNRYDTPAPGHVEQDMLRTWADCAATLRDLGEQVPDLDKRILALAVTGQGDGTWLIDRAGDPVGGGLLWLDSRAAALVGAYMATPAYAEHYALTGSGL